MLVVLADQMGVDVGEMYKGAMGPSVVQVLLFMAFVLLVSIFQAGTMQFWFPAGKPEARTLRGWALLFGAACVYGAVVFDHRAGHRSSRASPPGTVVPWVLGGG